MQWQTEKNAVAKLSVVSNASLVVFKLVVGVVTGSVSVLSEAVHSAVDLAAAVIAFLAVRTSGKPADEDHPYGHGKVENVSGVVEALLIFGVRSVDHHRSGAEVDPPGAARISRLGRGGHAAFDRRQHFSIP